MASIDLTTLQEEMAVRKSLNTIVVDILTDELLQVWG